MDGNGGWVALLAWGPLRAPSSERHPPSPSQRNFCEFGPQSCLEALSVFNSISVFNEIQYGLIRWVGGVSWLEPFKADNQPTPPTHRQPRKLLRVWAPIVFGNIERFKFNFRFFNEI